MKHDETLMMFSCGQSIGRGGLEAPTRNESVPVIKPRNTLPVVNWLKIRRRHLGKYTWTTTMESVNRLGLSLHSIFLIYAL